MQHAKKTQKLGRTVSHRRAMLANMATSLLRNHSVVTTTPKARVVRSVTEKLITLGKRGDLHARRRAARQVKDRAVLRKLFDEIAPQFSTRPGGYTRIVKLGQRRGDGAALAKLELLIPKAVPTSDKKDAKAKKPKSRFSRGKSSESAKSEAKEEAAAANES
jgi:large subunit ribosomal protein L17